MTSLLPYTSSFTDPEDVECISEALHSIPYSLVIRSFVETKNPEFVSNFTLEELNMLCKSFVYLGLDVDIRIFEEVFWHAARSSNNVFIRKLDEDSHPDEDFEWRTENLRIYYFLWNCIQTKSDVLLNLAVAQTDCTCERAAERGHLKLLKYLRASGRRWSQWTCSNAALNGHLEVLQWARQNQCPWNERTCSNAALNNHWEVLKWAKQNGCPWDEMTCANAAQNGHLEVLQWARKNGCPWNELTCMNAAMNGHLEVLQWAKAHGCPE